MEDGYSRGVGKEAEHCNELMHVSGNNPPSKKKIQTPPHLHEGHTAIQNQAREHVQIASSKNFAGVQMPGNKVT